MCKTPTWRSLGGVVGEMGMNLVEVPYVAIEKERGCKPGYVAGLERPAVSHLSRRGVASALEQSTPRQWTGRP